MKTSHLIAIWLALVALNGTARAADKQTALTSEQRDFFEKRIRPVLVAKCYDCHSSQGKVKGGLKLDSREGILTGGETGPAIIPGNAKESLLIKAICYEVEDLQMPPKQKLSEQVIADLTKWVDMGAPDPRTSATPVVAKKEIDWNKARSFWSFQPVKQPAPPAVKNTSWPVNDVDKFILAELEKNGLQPASDADKPALLRRICYDLVGLPPTPQDMDAFLADTSPNAFEKVVDKLLASPQFGERWGRHWLDVARYAESTGKERNLPYTQAWRYRDYVINAFNSGKPYDEFLKEQIAGDLMAARTPEERIEKTIATGLLCIGPKSLNERDSGQFRMDMVDDQIDTISQSMLGLTVACARCHDHKYDPIPSSDYYAMAGFFTSTNTFYGTADTQGNRQPGKLLELNSQGLRTKEGKPEKSGLPTVALPLDLVPENVMDRLLDDLSAKKPAATKPVSTSAKPSPAPPVAKTIAVMAVQDGKTTGDCKLCLAGNPGKRGDSIPRKFPTVFNMPAPRIGKDQSGRLQLAEWVANSQNPLTARVMANRIWSHLFGQGIVASTENFGTNGTAPTHPALLDYIAARFVASDWSIKKIIKGLVLSRTYQLSTQGNAANEAVDPDNKFYWRFSPRRLDAEAIRDGILSASGKLDAKPAEGSPVEKLGALIGTEKKAARGLGLDLLEAMATKRSVYLPIMRDRVPEPLDVFDFAEPSLIVGKRDSTNVATQALFLMNSPFILSQSQAFARRILAETKKADAEKLATAYQLALSRKPTEKETTRALQFIKESGLDTATAWTGVCQALFACAEFRYLN